MGCYGFAPWPLSDGIEALFAKLRIAHTSSVLNQSNGLGVGEMDIGRVFQDVSVVYGRMAIGDFDMAPSFERSKHHEEVGGAVALVLEIAMGRAPRFHRDRHARLREELL